MPKADAESSKLKSIYLNCSLKPSPQTSNTEALMRRSMGLIEKLGATTELVRIVDLDIPPGVQSDMRGEGWKKDDWPALYNKVSEADILVIGTPIWLGEKSSVCKKLIERLYGNSSKLNAKGQYAFYGKVAGCLVTGNEDGIKHCARDILYSLQHIGYTIVPQADAGWVGDVGPGPSYLDENSGGPESDFTNRNLSFMTYNLFHVAKLLKQNDGIPAEGNVASAWKEGKRFGLPSLEEVGVVSRGSASG